MAINRAAISHVMLQHKSEFIDDINLKDLLERMKLEKVIGTNHYNEWIRKEPEEQAEFLVQKIPDKGLDGFKALLKCLWLEEPEFADKLLASLGNVNKKCEQSIRKELLERMKLKKVIGTNHYNEWIGEKPEKQAEFLVQKIPDKGLDGFKALLSCLWLEEPEFADKLLASLGNENKKCEQSIRKELSGDVGDSGPLDEYNMTSIPRGQALIININKFEGKTKNREGSKIDKTAMETLLKYKLQFEVTVAKDLKLDEMKKKLKDFAEMSDEHKRGDCCIVVIMSHGDQRPGSHPKGPYPFVISSSDEKHLEVEQIVQMFNNVDALKGKPKVFIIQACRASEGSPFELSFEDIKFLNDGIEMDGGTFNPHDTFVVTSTIPCNLWFFLLLTAMAPIERATLRPIVYYEFLQGHSARSAADLRCIQGQRRPLFHGVSMVETLGIWRHDLRRSTTLRTSIDSR
ncbi:unnamed protein product [Darwinula stevensoni]|uniref:Caspase family p20 domain-containing protein n=1 Tax=Darwinula stevensoni TaxID=69355 RepID=A0A7R8XC57_9CRUS|nr:unnamed protein product [Darwinula stevensoni]CAG0893014.1 unnamed protein product [Darwinula stevensoni]